MAKNIQAFLNYQYQDVRVLFVEDEKFSREKLLRVLGRRFRNIHVAIDGVEGYQLFQKYKPDLVITDLKMNQMSGLEMIEKIRRINANVQVIVTTAHDENDFFIQSIENSVNHFILKPIDLNLLLQAIQKSVYHIQLEKELSKQKNLIRAILDFQDNLIFVIEDGEIVEFNQAFTTFTGIAKNQAHLHKSQLLAKFFIEDPNYFYPIDKGRWVEEFLAKKKKMAKVRWKSNTEEDVILYLKANTIPNTKQIIFFCTDITDLEEESKKNEHIAMMDPLTNSLNRNKFDEILLSEIRRAELLDHPFSLILMDIDYLKTINEKFGHIIGDDALITISTIVQQRIRECDLFARWGGEEFILLTPELNRETAGELADSIRSIIENFHFKHIGPLTCSFGVTEFSNGKSKEELLREVSLALSQSKMKGRNCVSIYTKEC